MPIYLKPTWQFIIYLSIATGALLASRLVFNWKNEIQLISVFFSVFFPASLATISAMPFRIELVYIANGEIIFFRGFFLKRILPLNNNTKLKLRKIAGLNVLEVHADQHSAKLPLIFVSNSKLLLSKLNVNFSNGFNLLQDWAIATVIIIITVLISASFRF